MTETEGLRERAAAMVERVALECSAVLPRTGVAAVRHAVGVALRARDPVYENDHDPRCLHPARTVLILLSDAACRDADVLAASAFVESLPHDIRADPSDLSARSRSLLASAPLPSSGEDLLERLITADPAAALIALAERLDHARHLHFMTDVPAAAFHQTIQEIYIPVAARVCPAIGRRLQKWAGAFARRHLNRPPA